MSSENTVDTSKEVLANLIPYENLVCFLYLLMRDHVPTGIVPEIIGHFPEEDSDIPTVSAPPARCSGAVYTNKHLEALARDYAGRICEG